MNDWTKRVKTRMKELGLTQTQLAKKLGITRGAITHYWAGRRVPPLVQFHKLAAILKVSPAWLQYGISDESITKNKAQDILSTKSATLLDQIPIFTWKQAARLVDATKIHKEEIEERLMNFYTDKSHWYALRIKGDSMTSPHGHQISFNEGDLIVVDSNKTPNHGDNVIALLPRAKEVTFKQYVIDAGTRYLKPLNPQYPIIPIDEGTFICGVVTAQVHPFFCK